VCAERVRQVGNALAGCVREWGCTHEIPERLPCRRSTPADRGGRVNESTLSVPRRGVGRTLSVVHREFFFCFIYKFRQRFGIVADAICCAGLGRDTRSAVQSLRVTV
jgi:hypothetical protein